MRGAAEVPGARVVPQPLPNGENLVFGRGGEGGERREAGEEALEIRDDGGDARLLEHDFAQPHAVRVARLLPPGQRAHVAGEPRQEAFRGGLLHRRDPSGREIRLPEVDSHRPSNPQELREDRGIGAVLPRGGRGEVLRRGADAPVGHAGVSGPVEENFARGGCHDGPRALRDDNRFRFLRGGQRGRGAVFPDGLHVKPQHPRKLPFVGRQHRLADRAVRHGVEGPLPQRARVE